MDLITAGFTHAANAVFARSHRMPIADFVAWLDSKLETWWSFKEEYYGRTETELSHRLTTGQTDPWSMSGREKDVRVRIVGTLMSVVSRQFLK